MPTRISIDALSKSSIKDGAARVQELSDTFIEPAVSVLLYGHAAPTVRGRMTELVHDESDSPNNTGDLKRTIASAPVEYVDSLKGRIVIRQSIGTDPLKEKEWGDKMHGKVAPPHDFTRENQEAATENAQEYWNENVRSVVW